MDALLSGEDIPLSSQFFENFYHGTVFDFIKDAFFGIY